MKNPEKQLAIIFERISETFGSTGIEKSSYSNTIELISTLLG